MIHCPLGVKLLVDKPTHAFGKEVTLQAVVDPDIPHNVLQYHFQFGESSGISDYTGEYSQRTVQYANNGR